MRFLGLVVAATFFSLFQPTNTSAQVLGTTMATVDLNADDKLDLVALDMRQDRVRVALNVGRGEFERSEYYRIKSRGSELKLVDINGDSFLDIVVYMPSRTRIAILRGLGNGSFADAYEVKMD